MRAGLIGPQGMGRRRRRLAEELDEAGLAVRVVAVLLEGALVE